MRFQEVMRRDSGATRFLIEKVNNGLLFWEVDAQGTQFWNRRVIEIAAVDHSTALVYSSYLGSTTSGATSGNAMAVDSGGRAYIAGNTNAAAFPTVNPIEATPQGSNDVFVAVFNAAGSGLDFSTYLGGNNDDYGIAIAMDPTDNIHVAGQTNSANFPTTLGAFQTTFVAVDSGLVAEISAIPPSGPADLTITKTHSGNFTQGQTGAAYSVVVSNVSGAGSTSGTVTMSDTLPAGFTPTGASGSGWTCPAPSGQTQACTTTAVLAGGASYPAITQAVNLASTATSATNTATVSGGGEINTANDSSSDPTTIIPAQPPAPTVNSNPANPTNKTSTAFTFSDTQSGVTFVCSLDAATFTACASGQSYSGLGQGSHTFNVEAKDSFGNASTATSFTWTIDTTLPGITGKATPSADAYGWNNTSVTVSFTCTLSVILPGVSISSCSTPAILTAEGAGQSVTGTATDNAGNVAQAKVTVNIDETNPLVTYTGGGTYTVDQTVKITCVATDALSGIASSTCGPNVTGPAYSFALGKTYSYSATATDKAGNLGSGSTSFKVTAGTA